MSSVHMTTGSRIHCCHNVLCDSRGRVGTHPPHGCTSAGVDLGKRHGCFWTGPGDGYNDRLYNSRFMLSSIKPQGLKASCFFVVGCTHVTPPTFLFDHSRDSWLHVLRVTSCDASKNRAESQTRSRHKGSLVTSLSMRMPCREAIH